MPRPLSERVSMFYTSGVSLCENAALTPYVPLKVSYGTYREELINPSG